MTPQTLATTTCTTDGTTTICVSPVQVAYLDWLVVNAFIIFFLALMASSIIFSEFGKGRLLKFKNFFKN